MRLILILIYIFAKVVFLVALAAWECSAAEPTLARLSFWLPPERMTEFGATYQKEVVPILGKHGLRESAEQGRATVDSVFARLFEVKNLGDILKKENGLAEDLGWKALLLELGNRYGTSDADGLIPVRLAVYSAPAIGKEALAGPGTQSLAGRGRGHWRIYDATDGLAPGLVGSILEDREGNIWFGAEVSGGVSRYDGQDFKTFTTEDGLAHNWVWPMIQDRDGNFWFGTRYGGVSRYDGTAWTTFNTENGLKHNYVQSIFQDREGNIWFGTMGGGASRYDGKGFTTLTTEDGLPNNFVNEVFQDRDGNFWFGTPGVGVSRYDGKTWTTFNTDNRLKSNYVKSIFQDRDGNLWFGTRYGGVSRYDGARWTTFTTEDGLPHNTVNAIFQDQEGILWFGTHGGPCRYDGREFLAFSPEGRLAYNIVWSIIQDREGNFWFGSSGGASRYDGTTFTNFTKEDGLPRNSTSGLFHDRDGNLWFPTGQGPENQLRGVTRYDGKHFMAFTTEDGLPGGAIQPRFQDREGNIWFNIQNGGVSRYDGQHFTTFTTEDGLPYTSGLVICQDQEGNLWFPTWGGGVSRYDGQRFTTFTTEDGLADQYVNSMTIDREGNLWFGTPYGGVSRYDGRHFTTFTTEDGLAHNFIWRVLQDREGHLWFGTEGGLSRYDGKTFTTFTKKDGLPLNSIQRLLQDREGDLWIGTESGVSRYDGKVFQTMNTKDGLVHNKITDICEDREGNLLFGTWGGLTRYRKPKPVPPPVFVDAVIADNRYEGISELSLPSTAGFIAFEFHGRSFKTRPEAMVYRYRLTGYDKDWKNTRDHRVEYQNMPRGDYTFEVLAVDRDLVYSDKPATVKLIVHLPYERYGLFSALGLAIVLIAWQSVRVIRRDRRLHVANTALSSANRDLFGLNKQLEASHRELQEKSRDLENVNVRLQEVDEMKTDFFSNVSHELRTPMTALKGSADNLLDGIVGALTDKQIRYVQRIKNSADRLTRLINDLLDLSRIDRGRTDLLQLHIETLPMREMVLEAVEGLRPMAESAGLTLSFEGEEVSARADRDRLVQVLTNLVGNAVKFTPAGGEISVTVKPDGAGYVQTTVRDTGKGIAAEDLDQIFDRFYQVKEEGGGLSGGTGLGLPITKELVELQDGQIRVESEVGVGSTFTFTLPKAQA